MMTKTAEDYVVRKGDTLDKIAKDHGTTTEALARYNHIKDPNRITLGQVVKFEPTISLQVLDRLYQPIPDMKLSLHASGSHFADVITSADGWVKDVILPSFSDILQVFVYKPSGERKWVAQIKPSGAPKEVQLVSPKVKVNAISAVSQGGKAQPVASSQTVTMSASSNALGTPVIAVAAAVPRGKEKSGLAWINRYPTSTSLADLADPFQASARNFVQALKDAGIHVSINATFRPTERSYLMHYSSKISRGEIEPTRVPVWPGVDIDWAHLDGEGKADVKAAKKAASAMKRAYAIGTNPVAPPGSSNHNKKLAMDLSISGYAGKKVKKPDGEVVSIDDWDDLLDFGFDLGVKWFGPKDRPHWSSNGK